MITSKQRAFLRALANKTETSVQIGKGGINDNMIKLINDILEKKELIKIHVLENAFSETREVCREVSALVGAEEVQVIGSRFVLYKESKENKKIDIQKLTVMKDTPAKAKKQVKPLHKAKAIAAKERKRAQEDKKKRDRFFKEQRRKAYSSKG